MEELNKVSVEISIEGKECDFTNLRLHQTMYGHHIFSIELNYRCKSSFLPMSVEEPINHYLGNTVSIKISEPSGIQISFNGLVKKVDIGGNDSGQGSVFLYGGSPTLLMMDDYSMDSFVDTDFASIVQQTLKNLNIQIDSSLKPKCEAEIPFVYRYKESSYGFLRRLSALCGENLYYDGQKMVSKNLKEDQETVLLDYRHDMLEMKISSTLKDYYMDRYDYDPNHDKTSQWPSPDGNLMNRTTKHSFQKSSEIYGEKSILPSSLPYSSEAAYDLQTQSVYAEHFGKITDGSLLRARTTTCKPALGSVVKILTDTSISNEEQSRIGRYRIIEVVHHYDNTREEYYNDIAGTNAEFEYLPPRGVEWPTAHPEVATVIDNADPENLGRVKVQYVWQQLEDHSQGKESNWMRVQTPDAGSSAAVAKNRGFFFVPEVGDQVMVGYEYGTPERPFVMGSLFHGNNTQGIASENSMKTIITRSGSTLTFDDQAHTILLSTTAANQILIDEKNGTIAITSAEEVNVTTKNVNIDASENMTVNVGKDFNMTVEGDSNVSIKGDSTMDIEKDTTLKMLGNMDQTVEGSHKLSVSQDLQIHTDSNAEVDAGGSAIFSSQKKLNIKSAEKVDIAKG